MLSETAVAALILLFSVFLPPIAALGVVTFVAGVAKQAFFSLLAVAVTFSIHVWIAVWTDSVFPQVWRSGLFLAYVIVIIGYALGAYGIVVIARKINEKALDHRLLHIA